MSSDHIEKLVSDIQEYLMEEERRSQLRGEIDSLLNGEPTRAPSRQNIFVRTLTLISACIVGSITVAVLLLATLGGHAGSPSDQIWLFAAGGCGIFFTTMLVTSWKRLEILNRIERNTRLILESKQVANELLEDYIRKVT